MFKIKTERTKIVRTRKEHICNSCEKTITSGNVAMHYSGITLVDEAIPYSFYICEKCMEEAWKELNEEARRIDAGM